MTLETYENLMRVQERRIAQARKMGNWEALHDAAVNKERIVFEWRERQLQDEIDALKKDKARLDSGTILLGVRGKRVHYVVQDLRAAIDAGIEANTKVSHDDREDGA